MAFQLSIVEAKQSFFPKPAEEDGVPIIDKETGEQKIAFIPGPYRITLNDGQWISVTKRNKVQRFSVNSPGAPIMDYFGRDSGKREKDRIIFNANTWDKFVSAYAHCPALPQLALDGIVQADAELAMRRAA